MGFLFVWDLPCFLIQVFITINFLLKLFWLNYISFDMLCFHLLLYQDIFISFSISFIHLLFRSRLLNFHIFVHFPAFLLLLISSFIPLWLEEITWCDFKLLKFVKTWFVTQNVIYPGECSICSWEESVFCCFQMECAIRIN